MQIKLCDLKATTGDPVGCFGIVSRILIIKDACTKSKHQTGPSMVALIKPGLAETNAAAVSILMRNYPPYKVSEMGFLQPGIHQPVIH